MKMNSIYWDHCLDIACALGSSPYRVERIPTIHEWILDSPLSLSIKDKLRAILSDRQLPQKIKLALKKKGKGNIAPVDYDTIYSDMALFVVGVLHWAETGRPIERRFQTRMRSTLRDWELKATVNTILKILSLPKRLRDTETALAQNGLGGIRFASTPTGATSRLTTDAYEQAAQLLLPAIPHLRRVLNHISSLPKISFPPAKRKEVLSQLATLLMAYWVTKTDAPRFEIVIHVLEICGFPTTTSALKQMNSPRRTV